MSHFSVLVAIPGAELGESASSIVYSELPDILEPYCESTENPAYLQFEDQEDDCRDEYNTGICHAVRFPDGRIASVYHADVRKLFELKGETLCIASTHSKDYSDEQLTALLEKCEYLPACPNTQVYPTFDAFMDEWHGMSNNNLQHRYGYFSNPQAEWDWYQIGGRWPGAFLVKDSTEDFISSEDSGEDDNVPGYKSCSGARKKDICWDKMKEIAQAALRAKYQALCEILAGTREKEGIMAIKDGALYGWSAFPLLSAGETEAEYLKRHRAGDDDFGIPSFYAYVDVDGIWHGQGDMGWFGISMNDKSENDWNAECHQFIQDCCDSTVLVMVDCHI